MPDTLYRYDEPTQQWVEVTNVNRIEVIVNTGGIGFIFSTIEVKFFSPLNYFIFAEVVE